MRSRGTPGAATITELEFPVERIFFVPSLRDSYYFLADAPLRAGLVSAAPAGLGFSGNKYRVQKYKSTLEII